MSAQLAVVGGTAALRTEEALDDDVRALLQRRQTLQGDLREVETMLKLHARRIADQHGEKPPRRIEQLEREFGR